MQCNTKKQAIRQEMKQKRRLLDSDFVLSKSLAICENILTLEAFKKAREISVYMSAFNEVDTRHIISACLHMGKSLSVPVVQGDDIYLAKFSHDCLKGEFGISEPRIKEEVSKTEVDLFIVPALAFDRCGSRVGFGKGYYDKLLSGTVATKIGLAYDFQMVDEIPCEKFDIKMDYVLTDKEIICTCNEGGQHK